MSLYTLYLSLLSVAIFANSTLVLVLYKRKGKDVSIVALTVLLLLINIWFAPKLVTNALHAHGLLFSMLSRISALGYIFVPAAFVTFSLANGVYRRYLEKYYYWVFVLIPSIFFLFLSWTTNIIGIHDYSQAHLYPWGYETPTGQLWPYYLIWFVGMMLLGIASLVKNYSLLEKGKKKRQALYIVLIATCPFIIGMITLGILPIFNIFVMPVGVTLLNMMIIGGISIIYKFSGFVVTPYTVLSNLNYAIITVDRSGTVLQMNPYTEKLLNAKTAQAVGKNVNQVFSVQQASNNKPYQVNQLLSPILNKGRSKTFDKYTVINTHKKSFPSMISITPIYEEKSIVGANIFIRNSKKEQERERRKDDFLNILAHELRTPITGIKLYNQLLLEQLPDTTDKKRLFALKMAKEVDRLHKLIQDSFELAQLQSGKLRLDREFFGIDDFIAEKVQTLTITYPQRKITVISSSHSVVFADKSKIEQVLINLINNAIRFSPQKKPIIVHLISENDYVTVGIQDFCKGITLKDQKKIFERFYQLENTLPGKTGLGLGLYISSSIVKAHEGKMWVSSKNGKGCTFYFSLPKSK